MDNCVTCMMNTTKSLACKSLLMGRPSGWYNKILSRPPSFKSDKGTSLAYCNKAQGVDSSNLVESRLLISHKFLVYLAYERLDILLVL